MNNPQRPLHKLIVLSRYPVPGQVKTRLLAELSPEQSADVHRALTEYTVQMARGARELCGIHVEMRTCGAPPQQFREWLGDDIRYRAQGDGDLGEKMQRAIDDAFTEGAASVMVIGSDCPKLSATHIEQALAALHRADVVLGPAADGGYYLIGLKRRAPELFSDIAWGEDVVLEQTRQSAMQLSLKVEHLETLNDVDRPEDLALLGPELRANLGL